AGVAFPPLRRFVARSQLAMRRQNRSAFSLGRHCLRRATRMPDLLQITGEVERTMKSITPTTAFKRARYLAWAFTIAAAMASLGPASAQTKGGPATSPPGAAVYFIGIKDGDTLSATPTIHFGLRKMSVAPAGIGRENAGHHHLIIDA